MRLESGWISSLWMFTTAPEVKGGILIRSTVPLTKMTEADIADIIRAYGIVNANVTIREDIDTDSLVDFLAGNRVYIPSLWP